MTDSHLVSVVIPAYNAEATLDDTLRSVRTQSHRALEIIVIDDGSTDNTRRVAERHASDDARVRVITQANAGVAAARNRGWQIADSDLIAFVDADDVWAPTKIERQLHAMQSGGPRVGLVYCWDVRIYGKGEMGDVVEGVRWEGDVLSLSFTGNFIGNGSSALVRRQALIDADGFDSRLRNAGAEGCEDRLFYCRVAEKHHFAVVPDHLLGYRYLPNNMSSDRPRMLRSWLLVDDELLARHPKYERALKRGLRDYSGFLVCDALSSRALSQLALVLMMMFRRSPSIAIEILAVAAGRTLIGKARALARKVLSGAKPLEATMRPRFLIGDLD